MTKANINSASKNNNNNNNKRNRRRGGKPRNNSNSVGENYSPNIKNVAANTPFPAPVILQEYEYAKEGAADRIIEMAEIEQERRVAWEDEYLRFYKKSMRIGQLFGFVILVVTVLCVTYLFQAGKEYAAQFLGALVFGAVVISSFLSGRRRKKYPRKRT